MSSRTLFTKEAGADRDPIDARWVRKTPDSVTVFLLLVCRGDHGVDHRRRIEANGVGGGEPRLLGRARHGLPRGPFIEVERVQAYGDHLGFTNRTSRVLVYPDELRQGRNLDPGRAAMVVADEVAR